MCGIAGFTHLHRRKSASSIRNATAALFHRGPDQQGVYQSDVVSLGAVRLRIIDLEGGEQPMRTDDGQTVVVFNGEIYNYAALREELTGLGHQFRSRCDTEVVLRAFLQWDTGCFRRLRGMFAVALWSEKERRLVLGRDRMGIKPLYFHRRGEELYFGSELKALFAHDEIERKLDPTGLSYFLSLNYVPCAHTLVDGIEKLPPGHWLEWRSGKIRSEAYWSLPYGNERDRSLDEAKEELDVLLRQSIKEHLIADVPLGVWASGGLDSSTILHYAAQESGARLNTFSVGFSGQSCDESKHFRRVSAHYGTNHHEFDLTPAADLTSTIEKLAYYSDEPSADAGALPVWYLSQLTRQHVTVALSGDGADELFGGYQTYRADAYARYLRRVPASLRRLGLRALRAFPVSDQKISFEYKAKRLLQGSLLSPTEAHLFWNGTFSPQEKAQISRLTDHPPLRNLGLPERVGKDGLSPFLYLDQQLYLSDDILYKCDRMSMAHSLEVRPPFLDHRIVEFAASLPMSCKVRGSQLKVVLRALMADKLPANVLQRPKEGFDIPAHQWLRGPLKSLLLDTLNERAVRASGLFHWPRVSALLDDHLARRVNVGYHLWGMLTLFLWMKRWDIQVGSAVPAMEPAVASQAFASTK